MVFSKATEPLCFCKASVTCVLLPVIFSLTLLRAIWVPQLLVSHRLSWRMLTLALSALTAVSLVALQNQVNTARFAVERGPPNPVKVSLATGRALFLHIWHLWCSKLADSVLMHCKLSPQAKEMLFFTAVIKKCTKMPMSKNPHRYEKYLRSSLASVFTTKSLYPANIISISKEIWLVMGFTVN